MWCFGDIKEICLQIELIGLSHLLLNYFQSIGLTIKVIVCALLIMHSQNVLSDAGHDDDGDDLSHNQEACNADFSSGSRTGTCDSVEACEAHRVCVLSNGKSCIASGHPGDLAVSVYPSIGSPQCDISKDEDEFCPYCQRADDFDCDGAPDNDTNEKLEGTTDPSVPTDFDNDDDFVGNDCDNCLDVANWHQLDLDGNNIGNACDPDIDGDGINNTADACPGSANNDDCNIAMCFPRYSGTPDNPNPPVIDGSINYKPYDAPGDPAVTELIDTGWKGAHLYTFGNGTDEAEVSFHSIKDNTHLYLGFEIKTNTRFHVNDTIILTLRPDNNSYSVSDNGGTTPTYDVVANNDMKIVIHPLCNSGADDNSSGCNAETPGIEDDDEPGLTAIKKNADVRQISIIKNSANNWSSATDVTVPGIIEVKVRSHVEGTKRLWSVELKLPITMSGDMPADWPGISDNFMMYFNVVDVDSSGEISTATQYRWPQIGDNSDHIITNIDNYPYPNYEWGKATRTNVELCQGVSIDRNGIGTKTNIDDPVLENEVDGGIIYSATPANDKVNRFYARVTNTGPNVPVRARFRIADWGYNGGWVNATWRDIPANTNGTNPNPTATKTVPAGGEEFTHDWIIADSDIPEFSEASSTSHAHQCVMVELDSNENVNFIKRSDYKNMNFSAVASVFKDVTTLSAKGYGKPPAGMNKHEFLIKNSSRVLPVRASDKKHGKSKQAIEKAKRIGLSYASKPVRDPDQQDCTKQSVLRWESTAYHDTGKTMVINGDHYKVISPAGGYGYYVTHTGCEDISSWASQLAGVDDASMKKISKDRYLARLDENEKIRIANEIKPIEKGSCEKSIFWIILLFLALL